MPPRAAPFMQGGDVGQGQRQIERRPRNHNGTSTTVKEAPQTNKPLQFVNITDPDQRHNEKNRKLVRSQAMRDFRKRQQSAAKQVSGTLVVKGSTVQQIAGPRNSVGPGSAHLVRQHNDFQGIPEGVWTRIPQPASPRSSLITCLGAGFVDPFAQAVVETKPYMYGLIEHFIRWLTPGQTPKQRSQNPLVTILVPLARSHAALFHAACSAAASNMTAQRGGKDPDFWSFYHRGHALRLLNESLTIARNRTSDVTIATILLISSSDHFFGNAKAFDMHKKAVQQIIVSRGGLDNLGLDGILKRVILWMSLAGAGNTPASPHIKQRGEEASSAGESESLASTPSSASSTASNSALPQSFTRLVHNGLAHLDILSPIQVGCTIVKHSKAQEPLPESFTEYASTGSRAIQAQMAEMIGPIFLHLRNQRNTLQATERGSIEHCISCAAPIYFCRVLLELPFKSPELEPLSQQLAQVLPMNTYDWQWKNEYGCKLWLAVLGYAVAMDNEERALVFAREAKKTIAFYTPGLEWEDLKGICEEWLWDPIMEEPAMRLWSIVRGLKEQPYIIA